MDYKKIYEQFIADRRLKESALVGYSERHHILPKSLGGTNAKSNIIKLTAGDHFFAHLLLAKIYGGRMWAPLVLMSKDGNHGKYSAIISRKRYSWAAMAMAKSMSGKKARQYDPTIYDLVHLDGRNWSGTQLEMNTKLGIGRPLANLLVKGKIASAKGWRFSGTEPIVRDGKNHPMYRSELINFVHVDGRKFVGTQYDLHIQFGVSKSMACRLARGQFRCANGWYIEGREPVANMGRGAKYAKQLEV